MTSPRIGIDTSVLVRLITSKPPDLYEHCMEELALLATRGIETLASNQVIGEAYVTVQHHYGLSANEVRTALLHAFEGGLVAPLNGESVLNALAAPGGAGLMDRLIAEGYAQADMETLTLDRRMASLPGARLL